MILTVLPDEKTLYYKQRGIGVLKPGGAEEEAGFKNDK
jgi:hypothetical protein